MLIAVAQTAAFTAQAKAEGMSDTEIENAITIIAANPTGGVSLGAGLYKVRVPREGGGKSGGYRVITLYLTDNAPVILLAVLSKGNAANFTAKAMSRIKEKAREIKRPK
ncbi:type II toxin-antitoxin system RelE/ParE family toxin [uncultured Brevundimonas sp.]|uniref:type II toxin-antitoxin system RelE/ParE family toxin n=1 Tax=uncultured Brevundimonas sp. TaxID=213418 RepID=UPI00261994B2|nr:type II toxin-antitoxin system RelE/ParE family toxin [uncultured Brevundimonas sp.]